jgi:thioredoxin 1
MQPHDHVTDLTDDTFDDATTTGRWTAVDLWAPWCGPCRRFMPHFESAATDHAAVGSPVAFARVNADDNPAVASRMAVVSIPTVVLYDPSGSEVGRTTGVPGRAELDELLSLATNDG